VRWSPSGARDTPPPSRVSLEVQPRLFSAAVADLVSPLLTVACNSCRFSTRAGRLLARFGAPTRTRTPPRAGGPRRPCRAGWLCAGPATAAGNSPAARHARLTALPPRGRHSGHRGTCSLAGRRPRAQPRVVSRPRAAEGRLSRGRGPCAAPHAVGRPARRPHGAAPSPHAASPSPPPNRAGPRAGERLDGT
jgi:hypothetical protein